MCSTLLRFPVISFFFILSQKGCFFQLNKILLWKSSQYKHFFCLLSKSHMHSFYPSSFSPTSHLNAFFLPFRFLSRIEEIPLPLKERIWRKGLLVGGKRLKSVTYISATAASWKLVQRIKAWRPKWKKNTETLLFLLCAIGQEASVILTQQLNMLRCSQPQCLLGEAGEGVIS